MRPEHLKSLLEAVRDGEVSLEEAMEALRTLPFREAAGILADTHRLLRQGFSEAVYAEGKTHNQVGDALVVLREAEGAAIATRVDGACGAVLLKRIPDGVYDPSSRLFRVGKLPLRKTKRVVGVVCAGTSDLPVAEEAAQVLEFSGWVVNRIQDVGVAGLHRLLGKLEALRSCSVLIVVAGMEGALPGVVGGLVGCPVIAVPTSVGYGVGIRGYAALLTMLSACASGLTVMNIDNGYGAAVATQRILNGMDADDRLE
jgi:pyridinium-3,5-biscarboxylic acid mononucleotide synthase